MNKLISIAMIAFVIMTVGVMARDHNSTTIPSGHSSAVVSHAEARITSLQVHADYYIANPSPHHAARLANTNAKIAKQQAIIDANTP